MQIPPGDKNNTSEEEPLKVYSEQPEYWPHMYWPVGAVRIAQFRTKYRPECVDNAENSMTRFSAICNERY